jgi:hypothetical protein
MKKKIWAICLTLVLALAAFAISGCSLFNDVGTISWVKEPAKVYSLNETDKPSFELKAELTGKDPITVTYPNGNYDSQIEVKNFTTATVGTRTATVTFEKLTLSFSYKVVDGQFADGSGSSVDPYIVTTADHFQHMLDQKSFNYYKLGRSIDLTGVALRMANAGQDATNDQAWVGEIDGAGFTVSGISEVQTPDGKAINKYNEIFGRVARDSEKFVLKNITFDFASTGKSATMGLVTSNSINGVLEFTNVKLTGYVNAANSGNSNISPYVSFLQRSLPGSVAAPLKSVTFTNCENEIKILNAYATSLVAGFASAQSVLPAGSVKFTNCKFAGLIEGSYQQGAGAFFANTQTAKDYYVFSGCTVAESAKIIKTAGRGLATSADAVYNCGNVCLKGETVVDGITGTVAVNEELKDVTIAINGANIECSVAGMADVDDYKIYAVGSMDYGNGKGGAFRYVQPAIKEKITEGKLTQTLLKIKSDDTVNKTTDNATYGSDLIVNENGVLVYYCGTVCKSINVKKAKVVVVAYKNGVAVAIGTTATTVNLAA